MNRRTREFKERFDRLPEAIREAAEVAYRQFLADPSARSLRHHELDPNRRGQQLPKSYSVSITSRYRAIYTKVGEANVWYWIGSHSEYNTFTGHK